MTVTMTMTMGEVRQAAETINKLIGLELPFKAAYRLRKLARAIQPELDAGEAERIALIQRLGTQGADGLWRVDEEKIAEFNRAFSELLAQEVEVEWRPARLDVGLFEGARLAAVDLMRLEKFVEIEEEAGNGGAGGLVGPGEDPGKVVEL